MSSTAFKAALGTASAGGVVGGGILVKNHLSPSGSTISELISKSKKKIRVSKDGEWSGLWSQYQKDNESKGAGEDSWKLPEWKSKTDPSSIPESYKQKCRNLLEERVEGESDPKYLTFLTRCTRNKNVGDLLGGATLLSNESGNATKWQNRFKAYKAAKKGNEYPIKGIVLADDDSESNSSHVDKLRNGCATQWNSDVIGNEEQAYLDAIKTWCSLEETKNDQ
ncbi:hypothetical protein HF1_03130 [Mycoplasma haemofelis str. Langford 1]|uniref:Uncharacterized protein n=1 Tax=Mycoplasma haemofelis (strain Langford 1) TaxID=941640 RepID=E8ZGQ0_MYCHL|nr:hypothetical protein [Mycoplasma haemofelis]CBY92321.1 hypothetical protein HF1_03130 [Mycoplasma haemofelis str. Langford 1]